MIDEDFNRTWGRLDQPATTRETRRAQVVRPYVERADFLLDLHSMHDDCVPLMLCGPLDRGAEMARRLGAPADIVRDRGHAAGMRMRDYGGFGDPQSGKTALLIETGQHWRASSVVVAKDVAHRFLTETGVVEASDLPADWKRPAPPSQRVVQVTHAIATKRGNFTPARRFEGQEVIAKAGTVLGHDDGEAVTTPYDDCVLVMPAVNRPLRAGVTVVRLGRLI
jgi:predicted deacylase